MHIDRSCGDCPYSLAITATVKATYCNMSLLIPGRWGESLFSRQIAAHVSNHLKSAADFSNSYQQRPGNWDASIDGSNCNAFNLDSSVECLTQRRREAESAENARNLANTMSYASNLLEARKFAPTAVFRFKMVYYKSNKKGL